MPEPAEAQTTGAFRRYMAPDMAMIGALVALFYALFLFQGYTSFFRDSDAGWHIRTGEAILRTGVLPHADPYSFSRAGQPWIDWEWLSDVLSGAVHQHFGLTGVVMLYGLAIAFGVWLWFRLNWDVGGNFLLACLLASPMLSTCDLHWLARPHVLSWLFFLIAVRFCERFDGRLTWPIGVGVAVISALWANMHGSFFFAALIPLIWAIGRWLDQFFLVTEPPPQGEVWQGGSRPLFLIAAIAAAATLLNPYGWHLHTHVFRYLTDRDLLDRVGEFLSFNFHADGALPITLGLFVATAGAVLSLARGRVEHFLFSSLLIVSALRSARGLPLVALLCLPLANGAITESLASARRLKPGARRYVDWLLAYGNRLRALDSHHHGIAFAAVCCVGFTVLLNTPGIRAHTGFPPDQFPVAAAAEVNRLPLQARIFAPDKFGGYLLYKFNGTRKVFFDGRSDFYGAGFLKDYGRIVQVRPGWESLFLPYRCQYALLPKDYSLVGVLQQQGWVRLYQDSTASLLKAPPESLEKK